MAYDDLGASFMQSLRDALIVESTTQERQELRTCDCPIVFEENPELVGQIHRYDCKFAPGNRASGPGEGK